MSTFSITINARPIFDRQIIIAGNEFLADTEKTLPLAPGTYRIDVPSCRSDVTFVVTDQGLLKPGPNSEGCLTVDGNKLTVNGRPVELDARYVAMDGGLGFFFRGGQKDDWIKHRTVNLLPGSEYRVLGTTMMSDFVFRIDKDGIFQYDHDELDLSRGRFLSGHGTSKLVFHGYPFLLDVTQVGERGGFSNVKGLEVADNGVQFANLLPMKTSFFIGFSGGSVTETGRLGVKVNVNGSIDLEPEGTVCKVVQDTFKGVPRLTVVKR